MINSFIFHEGCNDIATEGVFKWVSDNHDVQGYTNWSPDEPNDWGGQDCALLLGEQWDHMWDDETCSVAEGPEGNPVYAVCEKYVY